MEFTIQMRGYESIQDAFTKLIGNIKNRQQTLAECKLIMLQDVLRHFQQEEGPEGPWVELSRSTIGRRRKDGKDHKILQDTGRLRNSITGVSGNDGAEVGTNVVYGRVHNFGYPPREIPQRQFIWLSNSAENRIVDRMLKLFWSV